MTRRVFAAVLCLYASTSLAADVLRAAVVPIVNQEHVLERLL